MPDDFAPTPAMDGTPRSWGDAFASLPLEAPAGDGWSRLSGKLDAPVSRHRTMRRERRLSWAIGVASAAVLVLAAWSPLSQWLGREEKPASVVAVSAAPGAKGPAAPVRAEPHDADAHAATASIPQEAATVELQPSQAPVPKAHRKVAHKSRPQTRLAHVERPSAERALATTTDAPPQAEREAPANDPLRPLKSQSAQLEALIALARDDRVGNASNALLSGELDAGIAVVDAALSQADVSPARREELWQQRVELLQQLAGVEATSRWLAAQGASNETLLVSVD